MKKTILPLLWTLACGCLFCQSLTAGEKEIQIKGSDTMVNLVQAWAETKMEKNPDEYFAVTGGGSGTGIASLLSGSCHVAMCSRNIKDKEIELAQKKGIHPFEIKIALDGLAIIVHPSNPVSKLTLDQLSQIFSGKIRNWKELGGKDAEIVILSREVNSGTHVYFKEKVVRKNDPSSKEEFAPEALMLSSSQAIADEIAQNTDGIGYYGMGYLSERQKAVLVAKNSQSPYIEPTLDNVVNGLYPISRDLYFYTNGEPSGALKEFIEFCLSPEGDTITIDNDFVPLK